MVLRDELLDEVRRRHEIVTELRQLAAKAKGLKASLPVLPVEQWLDGTIRKPELDVSFEEYDLASLLQFLADVGVSEED